MEGMKKLVILVMIGLAVLVFGCDNRVQESNLQQTTQTQSLVRTLTSAEPTLTIPLNAGDRVEIEVKKLSDGTILANITDPFGNVIGQTAREQILNTYYNLKGLPIIESGNMRNKQTYPWYFSFIASTNGNYELKVKRESLSRYVPLNPMPQLLLTAIITPNP